MVQIILTTQKSIDILKLTTCDKVHKINVPQKCFVKWTRDGPINIDDTNNNNNIMIIMYLYSTSIQLPAQ